jgi:hypothetical protein
MPRAMRAPVLNPAGHISRHNSSGSLQRRQPRLRHDGGIIPHLDETQLNQRSQIVIRHRRQFKPIAKDVAKGPAKANGPFEIKICKRSFHPGVEMNDLSIGSAERQAGPASRSRC